MAPHTKSGTSGFTLIELAIVLAIAGLLFVGLWRLLAGGNTQLRDQSAAAQQQQLIAAVKAFLADQQGQTWMAGFNAVGTTKLLPLPTTNPSVAACHTGYTVTVPPSDKICDYLPPGFTTATANSYGQNYKVRVMGDGAGVGNTPTVYSFMIVTTIGDVIPDTSGGRISALIGGDGGFIYSTAVCGIGAAAAVAGNACGAFGAWAVDPVGTYGFSASPGDDSAGHIATRTFISPEQDAGLPWLARVTLPPDTGKTNPTYNTMTVDALMGGHTLFLGNDKVAPTVTGTIDMQAGILNLDGGTFEGSATIQTDGVTFAMPTTFTAATLPTGLTLSGNMVGLSATAPYLTPNPVLSVNGNCTKTNPANNPLGIPTSYPQDASGKSQCEDTIQVVGDVSVEGLLKSFNLFASTFIYQGASDIHLKTNIHPINNPLLDIMKLKPVSFTFKSDGKDSLGVIAQDVEKVYPQLVVTNGGTKYVNYDGLIGPLIGAVQELKKQNDELRSEIKILRQQSDGQDLRKE